MRLQAKEPEVSVVISAFRVTEYIKDAIDSVLSQRFCTLELIVVNDGCPDTEALERVLEPYRDRILYIQKENGGVSSARNAGIRAARGKWLAFLDGDDMWLPGYLESQFAVLEADPKVDMVFPNAVIFGDTALVGRLTMDFSPAEGEITFKRVLAGDLTIAYCALIRRELVIEAGMFDTDLRGSEDFNLWLRILKAGGKIVAQKKPLYRYRKRDNSLTSDSLWMNARILESLRRAEETIPMTTDERSALDSHRRRVKTEMAMALGKSAFEKRQWASAVQHYSRANQLTPARKVRAILLVLRFCPGLLYSVFYWRERKTGSRLAIQHI